MVIEWLPVNLASLGIVRESEKLRGGRGTLVAVAPGRLLDMSQAVKVCTAINVD